MLSKRTLYSFISFRFVKLALPRGHKSQKENVFEKKRRNKFGNFFLSQMGDPYFQGQIVILETCIFAVLFIKIELEFQSQKFPRIQALFKTLTKKVHCSCCFFSKTIKGFALCLCLWFWSNITGAQETQTVQNSPLMKSMLVEHLRRELT